MMQCLVKVCEIKFIVYTDWGGEAAAGQQETQTWVRSGNCVDKYYKYYTKNCF